MKRSSFILAVLVLATAGCLDDSTTGPPPVPVASFTVAGTRQVGHAITFDASASTDPAGVGLSYSWTFGDGGLGGTPAVAHLYGQAGAYSVKLTVRDAAGTTATATQTVAVAAGAPATGTAELSGLVTLPGGAPLAGVTVAAVGSNVTAQTAADGTVTLEGVPAGVPLVLRLTRAGYADGSARLAALPDGATDGWFEAALAPRAAPSLLASAEAGGTVAAGAGARAVFPAGGLVRADGSPATGAVEVSITPVDVANAIEAFPGPFTGIQANGTSTPIASFGVMEVALSQAGQALQVAPGHGVTLEIPIYTGGAAAGQAIPLWSLDEVSGTWVQEGTGTVVASAGSPTGLVLRAVVSHLSWWNVDTPYAPYTVRVLCMTETDPVPAPSTDYCFVEASQEGVDAPRVSARVLLRPNERTALDIYPGVSTRITGTAAHDPSLTASVLVASPTIGGSQDVDLVLPAGEGPPPEPVTPGVFVATGGDQGLTTISATSIIAFDGTEWQSRASPLAGGAAVASSGTMWVAGGHGPAGPLATSPDGVVWSPVDFGGSGMVLGLAWNGSMWVAVGAGGPGAAIFASSPDGRTWTQATSLPNQALGRFVAWNGSYWLAGTDISLLRSTDGAVWTAITPSPFGPNGGARAGAWNGSRWVVVGRTGAAQVVATSQDGVTWTTQPGPVPQANAVAWNGTSWLIGGFHASATSTDAISWTAHPIDMNLASLAWAETLWVGAGISDEPRITLATSPDGISWTPAPAQFPFVGQGVAARRPLYPPLP